MRVNFFIVSEARNAQSHSFRETTNNNYHVFKDKNSVYLIHTWSDKAFQGNVLSRESQYRLIYTVPSIYILCLSACLGVCLSVRIQ